MSLCGFLPVLLCDNFQVAAAAVIIPPCRLPPHLSPSSSEWPSSPSGYGHGARRWVLLLSPSNKKKLNIFQIIPQTWLIIRTYPLSFASVDLAKCKRWLYCITKECETFPKSNAPLWTMDTRKSDAFHRFGHCVHWVLGAAEAGSTEACQKDQ